jgi:hypothetical protein
MFQLPNVVAPTEVKIMLVRDGLRIRVIEADFLSGGVAMARASCQLLRRTENPHGNVWSPPNWAVPAPASLPAPIDPRANLRGKWTTRPIGGGMGTIGPRRLWIGEVRDLVEGAPLTPFVRVAVAADFASPFANAGDHGLEFISNALFAPPAGDGVDRLRGREPPRNRRHRDRRMLAL